MIVEGPRNQQTTFWVKQKSCQLAFNLTFFYSAQLVWLNTKNEVTLFTYLLKGLETGNVAVMLRGGQTLNPVSVADIEIKVL
jgi:hypothetical protein